MMRPIIIHMKKAHQEGFGKNGCIYNYKKKSKYSAIKKTMCQRRKNSKDLKILSVLPLRSKNKRAVNLRVDSDSKHRKE